MKRTMKEYHVKTIESQNELQTIKSIEAKSEYSLDMMREARSQQEELLMKMLLMSIEIDRKDCIIKSIQEDRTHQEFAIREQRYQHQIRTLEEQITIIKSNISSQESHSHQIQLYKSRALYNTQLEEKIYLLQSKLKKSQEERIESEEIINKLKVENSMINFNLMKSEGLEKNKVRELENNVGFERSKFQAERKASNEKSNMIESLKIKLIQQEQREKHMVRNYEDKLKMIHHEVIYSENLKKSQIMSSEERLNMTAQELARIIEENKHLKQLIEELRADIHRKDQFNAKIQQENKGLSNAFLKIQNSHKELYLKLEIRDRDQSSKDREFHQLEVNYSKMQKQYENLRILANTKLHELALYSEQNSQLKIQTSELFTELDNLKMEMRKLKRKPIAASILCESCKIKENSNNSLSMIQSQKSINNINDIIVETEQLKKSNRKIEHLITQHESVLESSINLYRSHVCQT